MRTNFELDWLILLGIVLLNLEELEYIEAGYCVPADVVVVDILVNSSYFMKRTPSNSLKVLLKLMTSRQL